MTKKFVRVKKDLIGPEVKKDTISEPYIQEAIKDLKSSDNALIMFNVHHRWNDDGVERKANTILLVFWRSSAMCKTRFRYSTSTQYIKETLGAQAYLEVESAGDLTWDIVKAQCRKKK